MSAAAAPGVQARGPAKRPAGAAGVFGARVDLADRYAELLASDGIVRGVIGPREAERIWSRHLFNSAALAAAVPPGARVVDLGSGAGLPGIPLAIARPDLTVVLLEPMNRRVRFLLDCLTALGLERVEVVHARAEAGIDPLAEVVVARAVAPLDRLIGLARSLLVDGGELLALKGAGAAAEVARLPAGVDAEVIELEAAGEAATVVRVRGLTGRQAAGGTRGKGGRW